MYIYTLLGYLCKPIDAYIYIFDHSCVDPCLLLFIQYSVVIHYEFLPGVRTNEHLPRVRAEEHLPGVRTPQSIFRVCTPYYRHASLRDSAANRGAGQVTLFNTQT